MIKNSKRFTTFSLHEHGLAQLFLIAVMVIIGIAGILYYSWQKGLIKTTPNHELSPTPTPDETANWKTYRNEEYDFEFSYPQNWVQKQSFGGKGKEWLIIFGIDKGKENMVTLTEPGNVELRIYSNKQDLSFRDAIVDELSSTSPVPFEPEERIQVITDNLNEMNETTINNHKSLVNFNKSIAYIFLDPQVVSLRVFYSDSNQHKKIFNKILSTFRFLD